MSIRVLQSAPKKYNLEKMFFENAERFQRQVPPKNPFNQHMEAIENKYEVKTWCEIGCGLGMDVLSALAAGYDAYGIDGSEKLREAVVFPKERYYIGDVTQSLTIISTEAIGCREVAEHIPFESSLQLVKNIVSNSRVTYFTAAPPGQKGSGHINCRTKNFWRALFEEFNWVEDVEITRIVQDWAPSNIDRKSGMVLFGRQLPELR